MVGHRLAPVGHDQAGIELTGPHERVVGLFVLESVKGGDATPQRRLRLACGVEAHAEREHEGDIYDGRV